MRSTAQVLPPARHETTSVSHLGCRLLEGQPQEQRGVLWGIPFAVKDNIDVAGQPTTAACPDFKYLAQSNARAVQPLLDAGVAASRWVVGQHRPQQELQRVASSRPASKYIAAVAWQACSKPQQLNCSAPSRRWHLPGQDKLGPVCLRPCGNSYALWQPR